MGASVEPDPAESHAAEDDDLRQELEELRFRIGPSIGHGWDNGFADLLQDAAYVHVKGIIAAINAAGVKQLGAESADEIVGRPTLDFSHPDYHAEILEHMSRGRDGNPRRQFLRPRRLRIDGSEYAAEVSATHCRWGDAEAQLVVVRDISDRIHAEDELSSTRALLVDGFDSVSDGLAIFDDDERFVFANSKFLVDHPWRDEILKPGVRFEEFIRRAITNDFGANSRQSIDALVRERVGWFRKAGAPNEFTDGRRWYLVSHRRMPNGFTVITLTDITERKAAEEALRESEERLRNVFELSPDAIYAHIGGRIVFANPAAARMFGYDAPESLIGVETKELYDVESYERIKAHRRQMLEDTRVQLANEHRCLRRDGSMFDVEVKATALTWQGQPALLAFVRDISERKRFERELIERRNEAEAANRAKSEFLAAMSHELRTPLNAIIGFSESINMELFGPEAFDRYRDYAKYINESGQLLLDLINDILDLAKIESGTDELDEELVCISDVAQSVTSLVRQRAASQHVALLHRIDEELPALRADPRKLKQMLVNLLTNAIKFTGAGGRITLSARRNGSGDLELEVRDTGIGIAPQDLRTAMSKFGQVKKGPDTAKEGTGLGLPLTQALVERHGGAMELHSEPGVGTKAVLRFPAWRLD